MRCCVRQFLTSFVGLYRIVCWCAGSIAVYCCPPHSTPPHRKLALKECRLVLKPQTSSPCVLQPPHTPSTTVSKFEIRNRESRSAKTTKIKFKVKKGLGRRELTAPASQRKDRATCRDYWTCNCPQRYGSRL